MTLIGQDYHRFNYLTQNTQNTQNILINRLKVTNKYIEGFESTEFVANYVTTAGAVGTEK